MKKERAEELPGLITHIRKFKKDVVNQNSTEFIVQIVKKDENYQFIFNQMSKFFELQKMLKEDLQKSSHVVWTKVLYFQPSNEVIRDVFITKMSDTDIQPQLIRDTIAP